MARPGWVYAMKIERPRGGTVKIGGAGYGGLATALLGRRELHVGPVGRCALRVGRRAVRVDILDVLQYE